MKRFLGYLILGSETKSVEIVAETMTPDSANATRFYIQMEVDDALYGKKKFFELVAQYPTDRLVIDIIEDID